MFILTLDGSIVSTNDEWELRLLNPFVGKLLQFEKVLKGYYSLKEISEKGILAGRIAICENTMVSGFVEPDCLLWPDRKQNRRDH